MGGLRMTLASREDVRSAARWYQNQRLGLGRDFIGQIRETFAAVSSRPLSFPKSHREIRRAQLHRFPFGIFFIVDSTSSQIVVLAVIDLRRHPKTWKSRG